MHKPFSKHACKHLLVVLLIVLVTASMFMMLPFFVAHPVSASPSPVVYTDLYYSQPTAQTINPTTPAWVTSPLNARDKNNDTYASFDYGLQPTAGSYFEVRAFTSQVAKSAPYPWIQQVDLKMKYTAAANTKDETYKIDYLVSPSSTLQPLQAATGEAYSDTRVWSAVSEPNNGVWDWTDIGNIRIRVTTSGTAGGTESSLFQEYEAWVTVVIKSSPRLFVDPANITDTTKGVGSTFTVYVKLENISSSAGIEFKFRYDPKVLDIIATVPTPPTSPAEDQPLPDDFIYSIGTMWTYSVDEFLGIVHISYTSGPLASPPYPSFGSGKVAQFDFQVLGLGLTTLKLYESVQGKPGGAPIPCDVVNGYLRNVAMPYGATLAITAPSTPVNTPFTTEINISKSAGQSGAFGVYSWEFNVTYDKTVINATAVFQGTYFQGIGPTTFRQTIDHANGRVWANSTLIGDLPGAWGNGTIATINFDVVGGGTSSISFIPGKVSITRIDYGLGPPSPRYSLPVTTVNGQVVVGLPVASFTFSPDEPKVHDVVTFDASASYDPDGNIVSYSWDFGDGSTDTGVTTTHAFSSKGAFEVNLTVTDNDGFTATSTKIVNVSGAPVATFTYSPPIPSVNQIVTFNASGSFDPDGHIVSYAWDYGDGTREVFVEGVNLTDIATHTYTSQGVFTVALTVTDNDTLVSNPYIQTVNVGGVPVPSFTYSPTVPKVSETVTFDASASYDPDGNIVSYSWDFGDGSTDSGVIVYHSYSADGEYVVNLTVTDNDGNSESFTQTVTVIPLAHDVAVASVTANPTIVKTGENVTIIVGVENLGDVDETFDVNVYFNGTLAAPTQTVTNLAPALSSSLTFIWNTTGVAKGRYEIKAVASAVPGEMNTANNEMSASQLVWVSLPPVASFTYSPLEPKANELVTFDASASYDPDGTLAYYFWDFGDGAVDLGKVVTHTYTNVGTYNVNLTVRDDFTLLDSEVQLIYLSERAREPSNVTISTSASLAAIGSSVIINGSLTPQRAAVTVTISFSLDGGAWNTLTDTTTDLDGTYMYDWVPTEAGDYELKASWEGDENTLPAESEVVSVTFKDVSSITITPTPTTATVGDSVILSGFITPVRVGVSVSIYYRLQGDAEWVPLASNNTDADGNYTQAWTPTEVGVFALTAIWAGDARTLPATSTEATLTIKKILSEVSISLSDSSVNLGSGVTINGSISPKRVSAVVLIQYKISLGVWTKLANVVTDEDGAYDYSWIPETAGSYQLRAYWGGDAITESYTSDTQTLSVEAPQAFPIPLYALAGIIIAVVAVVGLVLYFKFKKP